MHGYCMNGSPACSAPGRMQETRAASFVSTSEDILIRTAANAPANDALLHGQVRLCRVCRAETSNDRLCDTCIEVRIETDRGATLSEFGIGTGREGQEGSE